MPFQSTVNLWSTIGVPGDLAYDGPLRSTPYNLVSTPQLNVIGNVFTLSCGGNPDPTSGSANAGTAQVGGSGTFVGILVNSKEYASYGCSSGTPLTPTMVLPDNSIGELATMGYFIAQLDGAAVVGAPVYYNTTTGALSVTSGGHTAVPNCVVDRFNVPGAGLAVIKLTN